MTALAILAEARAAIGQRARTRDMSRERSMARAVATHHVLTEVEMNETGGWLFMAVLKLARAQQGAFHADDYVDAAAYCALAGECAAQKCKDDKPEILASSQGISPRSITTGYAAVGPKAADKIDFDALTSNDWAIATTHLDNARDKFRQSFGNAAHSTALEGLVARYNGGERSRDLYTLMVTASYLQDDLDAKTEKRMPERSRLENC